MWGRTLAYGASRLPFQARYGLRATRCPTVRTRPRRATDWSALADPDAAGPGDRLADLPADFAHLDAAEARDLGIEGVGRAAERDAAHAGHLRPHRACPPI